MRQRPDPSRRPRTSGRPRTRGTPRTRRGAVVLLALSGLAAGALTACGGSSSSTSSSGKPTLNWYINPNSSGSLQQIADHCVKQSNGEYAVNINVLPATADGQREQIVRRLAAGDTSMDVIMIDPPYMPEAANAGWLVPFTEEQKAELLKDVFPTTVPSATWQGKLYGAPMIANTQLLWYKKSVAQKAGVDPTSADFTWDQMIDAAVKTGTTVEEQGKRYEGYMVWVNAMVLGAGGSILDKTDQGRDAVVASGSPAAQRRPGHPQARDVARGGPVALHRRRGDRPARVPDGQRRFHAELALRLRRHAARREGLVFGVSLTSTDNARPVTAALAFFTGASNLQSPITAIAAASVVVTIPVIIMVLVFQQRIVAGLTNGAVKG